MVKHLLKLVNICHIEGKTALEHVEDSTIGKLVLVRPLITNVEHVVQDRLKDVFLVEFGLGEGHAETDLIFDAHYFESSPKALNERVVDREVFPLRRRKVI